MNKKLERYRQLRDKKKARLEKAQKDMDRLEQMVQDEENTQIVAAVRSYSLTPEELEAFLKERRAGGAPVSSKALFENVWDEEYTSSSHNAVMVYIRRLRKKLAEVDSSEELIETVWGVGYRIPEKRRG